MHKVWTANDNLCIMFYTNSSRFGHGVHVVNCSVTKWRAGICHRVSGHSMYRQFKKRVKSGTQTFKSRNLQVRAKRSGEPISHRDLS